ncbi:MAG TPA: hypothetical protein VME44_24865 [Streptosporangiaceae bacterium]|nr:hypothetical protein [Streptosporangiaceae bacterium]
MVAPGYLRFPHICGDLVTFVAADDVWPAPAGGGRAWPSGQQGTGHRRHPDDWAAGRDVQLETAVRLALKALRDSPAVSPPDRSNRPSRRRPPLPPRSA